MEIKCIYPDCRLPVMVGLQGRWLCCAHFNDELRSIRLKIDELQRLFASGPFDTVSPPPREQAETTEREETDRS